MATNKKIFEAFYLRNNGLSYKEIAEKTGIQKSYLSFLFNNFTPKDIEKIFGEEVEEKWWFEKFCENEWGQIAVMIFAIIGIISTILTLLKWI
jgi:hypothetical protein